MKFLISGIFTLFIILNSAAASVSELTCQFKNDSVKGSFIIALSNLDKPELADQAPIYTDYEGEETAISFDGMEDMEWYYSLLMSWDGGYKFDNAGNYIQFLDSDGCDVGILKLYANSGHKYGYTRVAHRCSGDIPDTYSVINCTVTTK